MDLDLSILGYRVVPYKNFEAVAGVIDWERAAFFSRDWEEYPSHVPSMGETVRRYLIYSR